MKIIITGAFGHIGSYVLRQLPLNFPGAEIVLIDNLMTQRFVSIFNLPKIGNYKFLDKNVTIANLDEIFENSDFVIHLAAITDAAGSFERQEELEKNNFIATKKIADLCLKKNVKLITLSSTSVYGTQNLVVAENCSIEELKPQSPYAVTKLKEEEYVQKLCDEKGLNAIIFRFGTIFGTSPGIRFHTAVNKFCWQAVMSEPITVWKTAYDQKRPYLDLKDASNAFVHAINNLQFDGKVYNVLTLNATVKQIVETIRDFIPILDIQFVDNKIMNQLSYEVSCERFKNTGFSFNGDLKSAIGDTINLLTH